MSTKRRKTRVRGMRMTYAEWLELRQLAREDGCTPTQLVLELVARERARRIVLADAIATAEQAKIA